MYTLNGYLYMKVDNHLGYNLPPAIPPIRSVRVFQESEAYYSKTSIVRTLFGPWNLLEAWVVRATEG